MYASGIRTELLDSKDSMGSKVRDSQNRRVNYALVIGDREIETKSVSVRKRGEKSTELHSIEDFTFNILKEIRERK
jgi:threonyl-tRNA synthetase